jgi:hypothetical protein
MRINQWLELSINGDGNSLPVFRRRQTAAPATAIEA